MSSVLNLIFSTSMAVTAASTPQQQPSVQLGLPLDCVVGKTCVIQQYVDHDPGPGARDYACGTLVYDKHDGMDFRLPDMVAERKGVRVLAAAPGKVLRARDGEPEGVFLAHGDVKGQECGNGVLIDHGGGWQTQYCHMARGSIVVKPGQSVAAGAALGQVGLSGETQFPHVHLTVRHDGKAVDPFSYGAAPDQCNGGRSLWRADLRASLQYRPRSVLNAGFASGPVTMQDVEDGLDARRPTRASSMVAYVRAIGLRAGDQPSLVLKGPDGRRIGASDAAPLDRAKAQYLLYAGAHGPLARGNYTAEYRVLNGGAVVLSQTFNMSL